MPIAGNMPIAGGLIDIEHISKAAIVAATAAPGLAQTWEQPPEPVSAGLTWLVHAALIVGQADGFALTVHLTALTSPTPTICRGSWASWWWGRGCR